MKMGDEGVLKFLPFLKGKRVRIINRYEWGEEDRTVMVVELLEDPPLTASAWHKGDILEVSVHEIEEKL